ncbi:Protein cwh43 [Apiospora aurea]|uniref:Protein cwh43 n=1 Tax=Apiospora aurea TaxID=335848 RepID=A0ABR1QVT9_9PEZI
MVSSTYKDKPSGALFAFSAKWVSYAHTIVAYTAFISALVVGISLHYHKIVENEFYGYPQEWFPSVSATIGDRYPERSFFQLFIALTSAKPGKMLPKFVAGVGLFRTFTCGGWTYVTSTDDHDWHDIFMISYLVATLPWTLGCIALSPANPKAIKYRKYIATAFFGTLLPLVYYFIQHKVHRVAGAYTTYAFFEWSLILYDVAFDAVTVLDFSTFEIVVRDVGGLSQGVNKSGMSDVALEEQKTKATGGIFNIKFTWRETFDTIAEVYHGYVFWSILTGLGLVIWYFPLWFMGISGYEALVMSTISPLLLSIKPLYSENVHETRLESKILAWLVGLVLSSTAKFAWWTNNPIWPIMHAENGGQNEIGLLLALIAAWRFTRRAPLNTGAAKSENLGDSAFLSALGVAGLFFGLHSLLSDSSTMISWVWEGYPVRGPVAVPHGWFTIAAMTAGLLTGLAHPSLVGTWSVYGIACVGAAILTLYANWFGYYGGIVLAFYLMAIAGPFLKNAAKRSPATTFGLGFFLYNIMVLFHVWVVAYAFVPGGPYFPWTTDTTAPQFIAAPEIPYIGIGLDQPIFLAMAYLRFPSNDYVPYHADSQIITAGIWTIHFSLDNDMWSSEKRIRNLLKELEVDVVGLLESDLQRIIMGNRDTTQFLAQDLGMYVDYGPGPNKHTWGAALLSKFPIVNSTHHLLPSPVGELAPMIQATLDCYGELVDVFVFHSGQEEDAEDRRLQSEYASKLMGNSPRPSILLSYLVTQPQQGNYKTYVSDLSRMHDVEPGDWDRWCEYILYKKLQRVAYARVSRSTITDTELQVAKFVVPRRQEEKALVSILEANEQARDWKVQEDEVPVGWRFPALFRGKGVRGHRYHVFDEPYYYSPKGLGQGLVLLKLKRVARRLRAHCGPYNASEGRGMSVLARMLSESNILRGIFWRHVCSAAAGKGSRPELTLGSVDEPEAAPVRDVDGDRYDALGVDRVPAGRRGRLCLLPVARAAGMVRR